MTRKNNLSLAFLVVFLKFSLGFITYPLYLKYLNSFEISLYFLFISTSSLFELLDFNLSNGLIRYFSYAEGGLSELEKEGISNTSTKTEDDDLFENLLVFSKIYYKWLCFIGAITIGFGFSVYLFFFTKRFHEAFVYYEFNWILYGGSVILGVYFMYLSPALMGKGYIDETNKVSLYSRGLGVVAQVLCIVSGLGLLSLGISAIISTVFERVLLIRLFKQKILINKIRKNINKQSFSTLLKTIWHNNYKLGLMTLAGLFIAKFNTFIAGFAISDLTILSSYLFTFQVFTIILTIAHVPISNNYADMSMFYVSDHGKSIKIFLKYNSYSIVLMIMLVIGVIFFGNFILQLIHIKHGLLPIKYLLLIGLVYILEKQLVDHSTMIAITNKVPMFKAYLVSAVIILVLSILLALVLRIGVIGIILPQLLGQGIFNYWFWVKYNLANEKISFKDYFLSLVTVGKIEII
jgi:hypothetical protein